MTVSRFRPNQLFDGENIIEYPVITVKDGVVLGVERKAGHDSKTQSCHHRDDIIELDGLLAPGYIDIQVNGGGGVLFNNAPNVSTLQTMIIAHSRFGTTSIIPTLITDDLATMRCAANAVSAAISKGIPGVLGIHFEGPHLSVAKKGVHPQAKVRSISDDEFDIYSRQDLGLKVVTIAPEAISVADIRRLVALDVRVCLGHSNAHYECVGRAISAGATGVTHLYNAMSGLHSRAPGMVGAALLNDDVWCGIILDNHHVHPQSAQLAYRCKTSAKMFLVTDAMALVGSEKASFTLCDETVYLNEDRLTISTGQLAGSHLSMQDAVKNAVSKVNIPLIDVLKMSSTSVSQFLGVHHSLGQISKGSAVNWVLLCEKLNVKSTWFGGIERKFVFDGQIRDGERGE